jgi:quinolinate synthase
MPQADVKMMYNRIQQLKKEKDVTLLAHYYMPAELQRKTTQGGIADYVGDSLGLSVEAQNTPAPQYFILWGTFYGRNCFGY